MSKDGYRVIHLEYGVDYRTQVPFQLAQIGIKTSLIGKVADIAENHFGSTLPCVETEGVFKLIYEEMALKENRFICANVQETDLAGHLQDAVLYAKRLEIADAGIQEIIRRMNEGDVLLVTADHGNDPIIGHSRHTRECVPILLYAKHMKHGRIPDRKSLSDVAATVADFFGCHKPETGESFLPFIF